jgi:hypothetical protein
MSGSQHPQLLSWRYTQSRPGGPGANNGTGIDDAAARWTEVLERFLRGEEQPKHIQVELFVEVFSSDLLDRGHLVNACVVDEDVELAERSLRFGEHTVNVRLLRDVRLNCDGLAAAAGYFGDDLVCARFAGGVVDDHGRAFGRELFGDGGSDVFGCACDDSDFAAEFIGIR